MNKSEKLCAQILERSASNNIAFETLCQLLKSLGFTERIKGSHHIFNKVGVQEILNLQSKGAKAKAYQVNQVRNIILKYRLGGQ